MLFPSLQRHRAPSPRKLVRGKEEEERKPSEEQIAVIGTKGCHKDYSGTPNEE